MRRTEFGSPSAVNGPAFSDSSNVDFSFRTGSPWDAMLCHCLGPLCGEFNGRGVVLFARCRPDLDTRRLCGTAQINVSLSSMNVGVSPVSSVKGHAPPAKLHQGRISDSLAEMDRSPEIPEFFPQPPLGCGTAVRRRNNTSAIVWFPQETCRSEAASKLEARWSNKQSMVLSRYAAVLSPRWCRPCGRGQVRAAQWDDLHGRVDPVAESLCPETGPAADFPL